MSTGCRVGAPLLLAAAASGKVSPESRSTKKDVFDLMNVNVSSGSRSPMDLKSFLSSAVVSENELVEKASTERRVPSKAAEE